MTERETPHELLQEAAFLLILCLVILIFFSGCSAEAGGASNAPLDLVRDHAPPAASSHPICYAAVPAWPREPGTVLTPAGLAPFPPPGSPFEVPAHKLDVIAQYLRDARTIFGWSEYQALAMAARALGTRVDTAAIAERIP